MKQKPSANAKFLDIRFKSKKKLVESFYVQHRDWDTKNGTQVVERHKNQMLSHSRDEV